jgi:hypothetical protein
MLLITIIDERIQTANTTGNNIPAFTAIAAVRSAKRLICFTAKTDSAWATISGLYKDFSLIEEFHLNYLALCYRHSAVVMFMRRGQKEKGTTGLERVIPFIQFQRL